MQAFLFFCGVTPGLRSGSNAVKVPGREFSDRCLTVPIAKPGLSAATSPRHGPFRLCVEREEHVSLLTCAGPVQHLVTGARALMQPIYDRMPVILSQRC
jgi:hypothetical protein